MQVEPQINLYLKSSIMKLNATQRLLSILLVTISVIFTSCSNSHRREKEEQIYEATENSNSSYSSPKQQANKKPKIMLDSSTAYVQTAGAGFRYADAFISIDYAYNRSVSAMVTAHANGKQVGMAMITIDAGNTSGYASIKLDGFYGVFEDRIPSTVTLKCRQID